jgi:SAM-dependent MidA family methyltransferase
VRDEFESMTESQALKEIIVSRIRDRGPMSFRDFMALTLYHPQFGYYCSPREKIGRGGDFVTSPEASPIFGALVGRQLCEMWALTGRPERFQIVEVGAGTGALCLDLLRSVVRAAPQFLQSIEYSIVEVSPTLAHRQREIVTAHSDVAPRVRWVDSIPSGVRGCILSNELLDSMPVHRVAVQDGRLMEIFVAWNGTAFVEQFGDPSISEIDDYFRRLGLLPGEGCRCEVNLQSLRWIREAAAALSRGYIVTFDYGHEARDLFAPWRRDGTLLCFHRHNPGTDPYTRVGHQDMTSHVDFTSLRQAGLEAGLTDLGAVPQAEFLTGLGISEAISPPTGGDTNLEEYYARRRSVMDLLDPAGLGRIRVLVQARGDAPGRLTGLLGAADRAGADSPGNPPSNPPG